MTAIPASERPPTARMAERAHNKIDRVAEAALRGGYLMALRDLMGLINDDIAIGLLPSPRLNAHLVTLQAKAGTITLPGDNTDGR